MRQKCQVKADRSDVLYLSYASDGGLSISFFRENGESEKNLISPAKSNIMTDNDKRKKVEVLP